MESYSGAHPRVFNSTTVGQRAEDDALREVVVDRPDLHLADPFFGQSFYQPPRPLTADFQRPPADAILNRETLTNVTVDYSSLTPPSLDKDNMCQSLFDFEKYCSIIRLPPSHKCSLLLTELKRFCPRTFLNFIRLSDNTYEGLKNFLLRSFESVAKIHKVQFDPLWIANDANSHFSNALELYHKTPPDEFVKFLVLKTSPPSLQKAMQGHLNLPYDKFYEKFKSKLSKQNSLHASYGSGGRTNPQTRNGENSFKMSETVPNRLRQYDNNRLCIYHRQYREKARNCNRGVCEMSHLVSRENREFRNHTTQTKNEEARAQN
jgi:hypothetical protein